MAVMSHSLETELLMNEQGIAKVKGVIISHVKHTHFKKDFKMLL